MVNLLFLVVAIVFFSFFRIICTTTIVATQTCLIAYGFWLTDVISMLCIASVILALIFNIFIIEYGYIFIVRILKLKKDKHCQQKQIDNIDFHKVIEDAEVQRMILLKHFCPMLLRYHFLEHYQELKDEDIKV